MNVFGSKKAQDYRLRILVWFHEVSKKQNFPWKMMRWLGKQENCEDDLKTAHIWGH